MEIERGAQAIETEEAPAAATTTPARRASPLSPLRKRNFRLLFIGQLISTLGDQAYGVALPWTVLVVTGDPRQMAIVLAAEALPRVLFLLLGGVLADRLGPRLIMLIADIGRRWRRRGNLWRRGRVSGIGGDPARGHRGRSFIARVAARVVTGRFSAERAAPPAS